jgi:hypothetical protein
VSYLFRLVENVMVYSFKTIQRRSPKCSLLIGIESSDVNCIESSDECPTSKGKESKIDLMLIEMVGVRYELTDGVIKDKESGSGASR